MVRLRNITRLWCFGAILAAGAALAQSLPGTAAIVGTDPMDTRNLAPDFKIVKGELLEWNVRGLSGDLLLDQTEDGPRRWRCTVTDNTFLSRASIRIHPAGVRVGDTVELVAEGTPNSCRARTLYIRHSDPRLRSARSRLTNMALFTSAVETLWPRGLLTFSGVVNRVEGDRLYMQTRKDGAKSFALREDTVFSNAGRAVALADLASQTRVFIRANRTFEGDIEVYQVIWGNILQTREIR